MLEEEGEGEPRADFLFDANLHSGSRQRVAAEIEEIVVDTYVFYPQHFPPDVSQKLLVRCARRDMGALGFRCVFFRWWQCLSIHFPVRGQRKLVENYERRRNHILRQRLFQETA